MLLVVVVLAAAAAATAVVLSAQSAAAAALVPERRRIATPGLRAALGKAQRMAKVFGSGGPLDGVDVSLECALCGVALNELEGFVAENKTEQEIMAALRAQVCDHLGHHALLKEACDLLVSAVPSFISKWERRYDVQRICVDELHLCAKPIPTWPDPQPVPELTVDLDAPPEKRWADVCAMPRFRKTAQYLYGFVTTLLPGHGRDLELVGESMNDDYFPAEYAGEIRGCAAALGVPYGWLALMNLGYEVSDACTSMVATGGAGAPVVHGRNLDFFLGMALTDSLKNNTAVVHFVRGGKEQYRTTTFVGMVGVLSGMRGGAFTVTINTRFYPGGISQLFWEVVVAIEAGAGNTNMVAFLARDAIAQAANFTAGVAMLASRPLVADVYYTVSGAAAGEGVVISRNRTGAANLWRLAPPQRYFLLQTNYDNWKPAPWFDDRRTPGFEHVKAMVGGDGRANATNVYAVMSQKPTLNLQTTYTLVSVPAKSYYNVHVRYCEYPCVQ